LSHARIGQIGSLSAEPRGATTTNRPPRFCAAAQRTLSF